MYKLALSPFSHSLAARNGGKPSPDDAASLLINNGDDLDDLHTDPPQWWPTDKIEKRTGTPKSLAAAVEGAAGKAPAQRTVDDSANEILNFVNRERK